MAVRGLLVMAILMLLAVAGALLVRSVTQRGLPADIQIALPINPSISPIEAGYLSVYLSANEQALSAPAASSAVAADFEVKPGETAGGIAAELASMGMIHDAALFRSYLHYYALDTHIEAGIYHLNTNMNIPALAQALTKAESPDIIVRVPEGWRREQIAASFDTQTNLPFHGADFLAATFQADGWPMASDYAIPAGASLEGFLFPDTYRLNKDAGADSLVSKSLANFVQQVTPQMRADALSRGMTVYQVVTLASIVERETSVAEERPVVASVYLNRLARAIKLEADPTVQYAMGYQAAADQWWNLNLTQDDYQSVDSPYNTYLYPGLPPGPIANPGLAAISAVIYPATTPYLFFRAKCDGSGQHNFAVTYQEHLDNACP